MHIVFDEADGRSLAASFDVDESMRSRIVVVNEDWSIGPLIEDAEEGGMGGRNNWLSKVSEKEISGAGRYLDEIKETLKEHPEEQGLIWVAPNSRDVSGYYYLVSNLEDFKGRLAAIWLNNLPFINDKGLIFYPSYLNEIPAKEFVKAKRLSNEISLSLFETDPDEWKKLTQENMPLRVLDGAKKLLSKEEHFFDKEILGALQNEFQKASRLIASVRGKQKYHLNTQFAIWRLRELINSGQIEAKGDWPAQENFEVKKIQQNQNPEAS